LSLSLSHLPTDPARRRTTVIAAALMVGLWLTAVWWTWVHASALQTTARQATGILQLQVRDLLGSVKKFEHLPYLVGAERSLSAVLQSPQNGDLVLQANQYLAFAQQRSDVAAIYVIDPQGQTLAASNRASSISFVGKNYRFRPYFQSALEGSTGFFYGVGVTTGEPGAFIAAPLYANQKIIGVVAIKIDLAAFESRWREAGQQIAITDAQGVIFLTTEPAWRYRSLRPLPPTVLQMLKSTRQYGDINPQALMQSENASVQTPIPRLTLQSGKTVLVQTQAMPELGWQMLHFSDPAVPRRQALQAAEITGLSLALAILGAILIWQHRRRLIERQASQRQLAQIASELDERIATRTAELAAANDVAVQTGKLAVLGQMAASISHEISQPLAALQTLAGNASAFLARNDAHSATENLQLIGALCARMGSIIGELKAFARKEPGKLGPVALEQVIGSSLMLIEPLRKAARTRITVQPSELKVWGDTIRLEQVMVNLLRNGIDAMEQQNQPERWIEITMSATDSQVCITVRDHGPGLSKEVLSHLFEPFFTTKPSGKGLGLGLSISHAILIEMGGAIRAENAHPGARFELTLQRTSP
jgi:two-component system, NtrC family, C4-dicarboxylate transport sensor histidine kinase DctB